MVLKVFCKETEYLPGQKIEGYTVLKKAGEGRYGICYLVSKGSTYYIVKQLKRNVLKKAMIKAGLEAQILQEIRHPNLPMFIDKINNNDFYGYVLEFKPGKTFEEIIFDDQYIFDKKKIYDVAAQLIRILKYLHGCGVVHRDIRIPNTLFYKGTVFLVDFGLARWIDSEEYTVDIDFSYLGDFLLHLYYTSYEIKEKSKPWYKELDLKKDELRFIKRLMGIDKSFKNIDEVETEFLSIN